jgi:hypothetical protein
MASVISHIRLKEVVSNVLPARNHPETRSKLSYLGNY